jgi:hypothetical protein
MSPLDELRERLAPGRSRRRRNAEPDSPAWREKQRRVLIYRQRVEEGRGIFSEEQTPERPLDELIAEIARLRPRLRRGLAG